MLLGNDIVDLRECAPGKERDQRFLERVFSPDERRFLSSAPHPELALWMLWAAKESAFKVMAKLRPGCLFSPRKIAWGEEALGLLAAIQPEGVLGARLRLAELDLSLLWQWNRDYVHCLAGWFAAPNASPERLASSARFRICRLAESRETAALSAREEDSVHSPASREVRLLAKRLLAEEGRLLETEIIRERGERFLPPVVWSGGRPVPGIDLSLSHDGRYIAAAVSSVQWKKWDPPPRVWRG